MTRLLTVLLGIALILPVAQAHGSEAVRLSTSLGAASNEVILHATDHVLVKLAPGADAAGILGQGSEHVFDRWRRVPVPSGTTATEMVEDLRSRGGVELAELDHVIQLDPQFAPVPLNHVDPVEVDDPYHSFQWHFPAIQLNSAWADSTGEGVVVAVVDTGITQDGEDLTCHTFVSPYNAITNTTGAMAATDDHGHGTHVAGTVAQCTNNGVGVAGVAFDAALMPVKVLDSTGVGTASSLAAGIEWARANGADVINLSLGFDDPNFTHPIIDEAMEAAVQDGVVIVAASGNDNAASVSYPASHPDVIAVGAIDFNNLRAPYSNRGSSLDLVAPGGDNDQDANGDGFGDGVLQETFEKQGINKDFGYFFFEGTSMATPHVSGAVALMLSQVPSLDPAALRSILQSTALDLGAQGRDNAYGHGLIQIHDTLEYLTTAPTWGEGAKLKVEIYGETELTLVWDDANDGVGVSEYRVGVAGTTGKTVTQPRATFTGLQPGTEYTFEVLARNVAGNWSEPLSATVRTARFFIDTVGHVFYQDVLWLSGLDITRGCNPPVNDRYCPDDPVTRGQMAAFMNRALGLSSTSSDFFFDDDGTTFEADINALAAAGISRGCNPPVNDRYCPDDPVTRGQMAAFINRALALSSSSTDFFLDDDGTTFEADINALAAAGITRGCNPPENDRFCPEDPVTRGQMAAFLKRALAGLGVGP